MEMKITNENFEKEVLQADKTVLADFYADWCGPCKMLSPVLHEIAEENADTVKVVKINVDEQPQLAGRFQVSSIPLLLVFRDGKLITKAVGYRPKSDILEMIKNKNDSSKKESAIRHPPASRGSFFVSKRAEDFA